MIVKHFKKNGFCYELMREGKRALIYKQLMNEELRAFEVHKKRMRKARIINNVKLAATNRLPTDEDFGVWAWSILSYERALIKFEEIEDDLMLI